MHIEHNELSSSKTDKAINGMKKQLKHIVGWFD